MFLISCPSLRRPRQPLSRRLQGSAIAAVLLVGSAMQSSTMAASSAKAKPTRSDTSSITVTQDERLALYAGPLAYMDFCGIALNEGAFEQTLSSVGVKTAAIPAIRARADQLVSALRVQNDTNDKKMEFCKRSKTIPVIKKWSTME